jgi:hypothetical protein
MSLSKHCIECGELHERRTPVAGYLRSRVTTKGDGD